MYYLLLILVYEYFIIPVKKKNQVHLNISAHVLLLVQWSRGGRNTVKEIKIGLIAINGFPNFTYC